MAEVNYTSETNLESGYVKVQWSNLTSGDHGQPFNCHGLGLGSVHYWGDFNPGPGLNNKVVLGASNELSPSAPNWGELLYSYSPRMQMPPNNAPMMFVGAVWPIAEEDITNVSVAVIFVPRE
jgi:hypothetical protein